MSRRPSAYATIQIDHFDFRIPVYADDVVDTVEGLALWRYARHVFGRSALLTKPQEDSWTEDRSAVYWSANVYTPRAGWHPLFWVERADIKARNRKRIEAAIERANKAAR